MKTAPARASGVPSLPAHFRPRKYAPLWHAPAPGWREALREAVETGCNGHHCSAFFRADDIGAGGRSFEALCDLFRRHRAPVGMAVVPAWLSGTRIEQLFRTAPADEPLWGWHQHGWRHINWQRTGKKAEFGEQRPLEKQWNDIESGRKKMEEIFGERASPVFTPPWNRLSAATVKILLQMNFRGVSLLGPMPRGVRSPAAFRNLRIQVDLHTRRSRDPETDYPALLAELTAGLRRRETLGIMIHHQRMTLFSFEFLDELVRLLAERHAIRSLRETLENDAH